MNTINKNEYAALSFLISRTLFAGVVINCVCNIAKQDAWLSILLSFIIGIIPLWLFIKLLNFEPTLNIIQIIDKYFQPIIATIIKIIIITVILFDAGIILWDLSNFVNSQFLFRAPFWIVAAFFMLPVVYILNKGLPTIGRASIILFLISTFMYVITFLALVGKLNFSNVMPIFENGPLPIIKGSLIEVSYNLLSLFILLIIPKENIKKNDNLNKTLIFFYILNAIMTFLTIFFIISIFGERLANLYQFPEFHILKTINVANFFQRVESILSFQWLSDFIVCLALCIYFTKFSILSIFKSQKNNKTLVLFLAIIIIILSVNIFKNNTIAYNFLTNNYQYIRIIILFTLMLVIYITAYIKSKLSIKNVTYSNSD